MLKQDDKKEFIMTMLDEINVYEERNHWMLMKHDDKPMNKCVNGKHKVQLCARGRMQIWRVDFWETYSPV
eukprot:11314650-Ditylum_brightwellii.AAC.1